MKRHIWTYIIVALFILAVTACSAIYRSGADGGRQDQESVRQAVEDAVADFKNDTLDAGSQEDAVAPAADTAMTIPAMEDTVDKGDLSIDETIAALDSILASKDSPAVQDTTLHVADTAVTVAIPVDSIKGKLDMPAFSGARDSIIEDMTGGRQVLYYYGDVTVSYGDISIKADYMAYDVGSNMVYARGSKDFDGNWTGLPEMTMGGSTYSMEEVYYNFESRKAKIKNMTTNQQEGELRGEKLKMEPDQSINIKGGKYTVCDAPHPHYYLNMSAAKIMTKPNQKIVFGPANVVIEDVPLPIALPFGFVPDMPDRASGLMMPNYGEEAARGLYLKDLGYYFVLGDHFDLSLNGDIFSYGSWAIKATSRYKKRYAFDGNLALNYSVDITGERGMPDYNESKNFGVQWSHSQDSKAKPGTSFRASVNFSSPSNNRFNTHSINEAIQNQASSSVSYSKTLPFGSLSINALHSQNSRDSSYTFTLPNLTFSVNRFYPFKNNNRVGKEKLYEKISLSYNTTFQNKISFKASEFMQPGFMDRMDNGMQHSFAVGLPQFTLLKYLNFSPSISYGMNWLFRENSMTYDPETDKVITQMSNQFSTFGVTQNYSAGISMSTRIYGMFNFNPKGKLQAIRHMITPSFSLSYHPELGTAANGYTSYTYRDAAGVEHTTEYNKYSGMMYAPPGKGRSGSLSFSFGNNLEAKIKNAKDTTGSGTTKVKLIDQLNFAGSYNFLADSLKLSTISVNGSTTVFGKLGLNGNMTLDPYAVDGRGMRINKFNVMETGNPFRLTNASASMSYSFSGKGTIEGNDGKNDADRTSSQDYYRVYYHPVTGEYIPGGWLYYLNPNSPWSVNLNLNFAYSKSYSYANEQLQTVNNFTETVSVSGNLKLTNALNFTMNTGLDLSKMALTTSQISATYDLHCFNISVSWVPTGQWKSWSFRIAANASSLSDLLKYQKASSYWDN